MQLVKKYLYLQYLPLRILRVLPDSSRTSLLQSSTLGVVSFIPDGVCFSNAANSALYLALIFIFSSSVRINIFCLLEI